MISHVCQLEDKPWEAEGLLGRKKETVLFTMRCVQEGGDLCMFPCVCQGMAEIQWDQWAYGKEEMLALERL